MGRMGGGPDHPSVPEEFANGRVRLRRIRRPATAIWTTPTSRCCCAGWSTFPSRPRCGLPSADPAPIGRVDAGADAVIIAMVESAEQAAAAVAATRYAPAGLRSFGPLRASLGHDPAALEARVIVFAMIETAQGLSAVDEICAVPGLTGVYVGPADLAISLGYDLADAWTNPTVRGAMSRVQSTASAAGLVTGIHAGTGKLGKAMAELGFRMITLASESQSLRRGAAEHLKEATAE